MFSSSLGLRDIVFDGLLNFVFAHILCCCSQASLLKCRFAVDVREILFAKKSLNHCLIDTCLHKIYFCGQN